jgi:signal transduction histidine kinase
MAAKPTAELVREVLAHLNDRAYLAAHPSLAALGGPERLLPATQLRDAVVEAIEQLRPMGPPAPQSPAWRRHRNLVLRHLEGQSVEQVARALGVSVRQAIRDHREAVEALAVLLQSALGAGEGRTDEARPAGRPPEENGQPQPSPEMASVAGGEKAADLVEVLGGVLPVIEEMARSRRVSFSTQDLDTLPTVAVNPTLLRQAMLHLLAYAAEVAPGRELLVVGADTPGGVILRVLPRPGVPNRSRRPDAGSPRPASAPE